MKKIIALLLAGIMLAFTLALVSCKNNDNPGESTNGTTTNGTTTQATTTTEKTETPTAPTYASALDLFNKIWASYTDDEKFPCGGGDADHDSEDGPGIFDTENEESRESLKTYTHITGELLGMVTNDVATLMHMMNTNTFSSAIFHLKDASTAEKFAADYNTAIQNTHWMCGFPERVAVVSVGEYIIVVFGYEELTSVFTAKCLAVDTSAKVLLDNAIDG